MNNISPLVTHGSDGEPTTTSLVIAEGTGNEHASVIRLVRNALADFEEFGRVGFEIAPFETAGRDDETDAVATRWSSSHDPEYFGFVAAAALSFMTRHILGPTLDAAARVGLDLRPGLAESARNANATLGGGS